MAEERSEHRRSHGGELHDASDDDFRQRIDVPSGGDEHGRYGDKYGSDTDREPSAGSADDHHATSESDGDGGTDGDVHGGGSRNGSAELSVAEERSEYRRSHGSELHDTGDDDFRQRIDVRCGGRERGGHGDEQCGDADGERSARTANDHDSADGPDSHSGTGSDVHSGGGGNSATELSVAEERSKHRRSDVGELHDTGNHDFR